MSMLAKKRKHPEKRKENKNLLKTKRIINIKVSAIGGPVFTFSLPGGQLVPFPPLQLRHWRQGFVLGKQTCSVSQLV